MLPQAIHISDSFILITRLTLRLLINSKLSIKLTDFQLLYIQLSAN